MLYSEMSVTVPSRTPAPVHREISIHFCVTSGSWFTCSKDLHTERHQYLPDKTSFHHPHCQLYDNICRNTTLKLWNPKLKAHYTVLQIITDVTITFITFLPSPCYSNRWKESSVLWLHVKLAFLKTLGYYTNQFPSTDSHVSGP
jgi:hypothetical protein